MSNGDLKVYASDQINAMFLGRALNEGRAKADFLTITALEPDYTSQRGADGQTTRSRSNNRGKTIKIKTMATSLVNSILNEIRQLDLAAPNGAGVGLFEVNDRNNGKLVLTAPKTWIVGPPECPYGPEAGEREWTLECAAGDDDLSGYPSV